MLCRNINNSYSPYRPSWTHPEKSEAGWRRLCVFPCKGEGQNHLHQATIWDRGMIYICFTGLPVSSWHHLVSISIFSLPWVRIPTSDTSECRQSVLELSLAMTGEEKCSLNKCCALHSVPGINCSAVASFGGATQKAVKASKKSQHTQCWVHEGRSKFNGLHELSSKPSADFSIFSGTFSFRHRSDIYRS